MHAPHDGGTALPKTLSIEGAFFSTSNFRSCVHPDTECDKQIQFLSQHTSDFSKVMPLRPYCVRFILSAAQLEEIALALIENRFGNLVPVCFNKFATIS